MMNWLAHYILGPFGRDADKQIAEIHERVDRAQAELAAEAIRAKRSLSNEPIIRSAQEAAELFERRGRRG